MKKKVTAIIVMAALAAFALAACGQKKEMAVPSSSAAEPAPVISGSGADLPGMLVGGWTLYEAAADAYSTAEATAALEKALANDPDAKYELVSLLGTQVVAGTNYEFLCAEPPATPDAAPTLSFVVVYEDLEGNAEITHAEVLDLGTFEGAENPTDETQFEQLAGGWTIPQNISGEALPEEVATAYEQAMKDETGYTPVVLLASQVVAGANYAILAFDQDAPCLVYIYAPLEGDAELTSIYKINMGEFSGN